MFSLPGCSVVHKSNTVKPTISYYLKCLVLKVAYGTWSLTRIEQQGVSFEKLSGLIYFIEDVLHVIS